MCRWNPILIFFLSRILTKSNWTSFFIAQTEKRQFRLKHRRPKLFFVCFIKSNWNRLDFGFGLFIYLGSKFFRIHPSFKCKLKRKAVLFSLVFFFSNKEWKTCHSIFVFVQRRMTIYFPVDCKGHRFHDSSIYTGVFFYACLYFPLHVRLSNIQSQEGLTNISYSQVSLYLTSHKTKQILCKKKRFHVQWSMMLLKWKYEAFASTYHQLCSWNV